MSYDWDEEHPETPWIERRWTTDETRVSVHDKSRGQSPVGFVVYEDHDRVEVSESLCEAFEYVYDEYGIVPSGSVWSGEHGGFWRVYEVDDYITVEAIPGDARTVEKEFFDSLEFVDAGF